jgi:hypothetical protein
MANFEQSHYCLHLELQNKNMILIIPTIKNIANAYNALWVEYGIQVDYTVSYLIE